VKRAAAGLVLVLSTACCGTFQGGAEGHVRGALDLLADVVDPSYALAMAGCMKRQDQVMTEGEQGTRSVADVDQALHAISARCDTVREAFEAIRLEHDRARAFVGAGNVAEAERAIATIRRHWLALQENTP
jgi:hypothetical protein